MDWSAITGRGALDGAAAKAEGGTMNPRIAVKWLNYLCFTVGMVGLWWYSEDWVIIGLAFLASLHFSRPFWILK